MFLINESMSIQNKKQVKDLIHPKPHDQKISLRLSGLQSAESIQKKYINIRMKFKSLAS